MDFSVLFPVLIFWIGSAAIFSVWANAIYKELANIRKALEDE